MVISEIISQTFFLIKLNQKRNYLYFFLIFLIVFFLSEILFILGFPEITKLFDINNFDNIKNTFEINLILFSIDNIYTYTFIFIINFLIKILILKIIVNYSADITKNISQEYLSYYLNELDKNNDQNLFDEFRSNLTVRLEILYSHFLIPAFTLIFTIIALLSGIIALCIINIKLTVFSISLFLFCYFFFFILSKKKLKQNNILIKDSSLKLTNTVDNLLKDYKGLIINNDIEFIKKQFIRLNYDLKISYGMNHFLGQIPRYSIETIGFISIILFATLTSSNLMPKNLFIFFTSFGLAAIRLLPVFQRFYSSLTTIFGTRNTWGEILKITKNSYLRKKNIQNVYTQIEKFKNFDQLSVKNVNYSYIKKGKELKLFENNNFLFQVGKTYLIRGRSGKGKTTLLDIISGIKKPNSAEFYIDGNKIKNLSDCVNVYYLSQDASIPNGNFLNWFDRKAMNNATKIKKIKELFEVCNISNYLPENLNEWEIKDNSRNLSVGQRQRIFIARAIWKNCKIIILDEPTSGMDKNNENDFLKLITSLLRNSIILIATHSIDGNKENSNLVTINLD